MLARYIKAFHFLTSFFSYSPKLNEFAEYAEYLGPQLIKQGSVSDLMKQIRQTEVIKAAVQYQGVTTEALYIKQVTKEKSADSLIHATVSAHRDDQMFLEGAYRGQLNAEIQTA